MFRLSIRSLLFAIARQATSGSITIALLLAPFAFAQSPRADVAFLAGGQQRVYSVAYSPDGSMLASGGDFGDTINLWRASDGALIRTFATKAGTSAIFGPMSPVTFSADGRTIVATGEGSHVGVWNVADGALIRATVLPGPDLSLSTDGTFVAVAASNAIKMMRLSDGVVFRSIPWPSGSVQRVAFSLDGAVVAGADNQGFVRTFQVADGAPLLAFQAHATSINTLRYSPSGTRLATGAGDGAVKLWDSVTGQLNGTLTGHSNSVTAVAFSRDGALLASGSTDATVKLWAMPGGALVGTLPQPRAVDAVNFNSTSTRVAVGLAMELREWDVPSQTLVRNLLRATNGISATAFSPDSTQLVSGSFDGKVTVTAVQSGAIIRQVAAGGAGASVFVLAATEELFAAAVNVPNVIKLFRLNNGAFLRTMDPGSQAHTRSIAFSPDRTLLATGHVGNAVRLWNVANGALVRTFLVGGSGDVNGIAFTADGARIVTADVGGFVRVWDTKGNLIRSMGPAGQALATVALSPDSQFALAGGVQGMIQMWNIETGALMYSFTAPGNREVTQVRFTPDGFAFYAGRSDGSGVGTLRVYRTADHAALASYNIETGVVGNNPSGPLAVDVSPDGRYVAYGRDDGTIVVAHNTLIAAPTSAVATAGEILQGSSAQLVLADAAVLTGHPASGAFAVDLQAHLVTSASGLSFQIVATPSVAGVRQEVWMRNATSGLLELVDARLTKPTEQTTRVDLDPKFARFTDPSGNVAARLKWSLPEPIGDQRKGPLRDWTVNLDQAIWGCGL